MSRLRQIRSWLLAAIFAISSFAFADSHARIVRLSYVEGPVQLDRRDGSGLQTAFLNMPINDGAHLVTGSSGRAEVQFEDGSAIRLAPDSNIEFAQLGLRDDGGKVTNVHLESGSAYFNFQKHDKDAFQLDAAQSTVQLAHSSEFRAELVNGKLNLAVMKGEVKINHAGEEVAVKKGETLSFDPAADHYAVAKEIAPQPLDQWNSERDQYVDEYAYGGATSYNTGFATSYNPGFYNSYSPYYYGLGDLNYYGAFFDTPWGPVWRPYYAGAGWQPFADGCWAFYPGIGYTWVSAYPWGWLPYHYGTWEFLPVYGWVWQPGMWNTWVPFSGVAGVPPGFSVPTPPARHGGGRVGIIAVGHGASRGPSGFGPGGEWTLAGAPGASRLGNMPGAVKAGAPVGGLATAMPQENAGEVPSPRISSQPRRVAPVPIIRPQSFGAPSMAPHYPSMPMTMSSPSFSSHASHGAASTHSSRPH